MDESKQGHFKVPSIPIPRKKNPQQQESVPTKSAGPLAGSEQDTDQVISEIPSDSTSSSRTESPTEPQTITEGQSSDADTRQQSDSETQPETTKTDTKTTHTAPKKDEISASPSEKHTISQQSFPPLPYTVPHWSKAPTEPYFMSVIKNGIVIEEVSLSGKPFITFGRLPCCDVQLEHPSLSRYHAVLQYRPHIEGKETEESHASALSGNPKESGYYVYDLGSTHGTYINKTQINARCYYRLRVGQMVKFGGSSRMFLLESGTGSQADIEAGAEDEIREIMEQRKELEKKKAESEAAREQAAKEREGMGVMWGMVMDDGPEGQEEDIEIDPEREKYYIDDPKKALKKFFDREGLELEYETEEEGPSRARVFTAKVRLPIDTASGESVYAEASVQGKKKEAVLQCALNACRILDANDMLRENSQKREKRKRNWEENDYYDSDEDTFLDRTGAIEVKRKQRMKKAGVAQDKVETFDSLQEQMKSITKEIAQIEHRLHKNQQVVEGAGEDDLDQFMKNVSSQLDPSHKRELKQRLHSLKKDEERVKKLISIARPTEMPAIAETDSTTVSTAKRPKVTKFQKTLKTETKKASPGIEGAQDDQEVQHEEREVTKAHKVDIEPKQSQDELRMDTDPPRDKETRRERGPLLPERPPVRDGDEETTQNPKWQNSEDYSDWMPPEHQSGDGRTHLNEKYGY